MAFIGNTNTTQAFTPAVDYFSGTGSATAFTLSRPVASVAQVQVVIDNVAQNPSSAYTVSGSTITFTSAPLSGTNNIYVYYTSPITQVIAPGQGTVTATSMASSTGTGAGVFQTSPTLVTPVLGAASATSITVAAGAVGTPSITTTGDTNTGIFFPAADTIAFSEGGAESMRINSSGSLLVGTTSSTVGGQTPKLGVVGSNNATISVDCTASSGASGIHIRRSVSGTGEVMTFDSLTTRVGSISITGSATAYNTSSDYRLKENILPMTGALAKVAQLKPVTYKWKADGSDGEGFIAHELAEVCSHAVSGEKDATRQEEYEVTPAVKDEEGNTTTPAVMGTRTVPEYQGIDVSFLVATLTSAIQELKAINDTQAATITALTARIEALETK